MSVTEDQAKSNREVFRTKISREDRVAHYEMGIDPGFVHRRKIETILGVERMELVDYRIKSLPESFDREVRIDHIFTQALLEYCRDYDVPTFAQLACDDTGSMFCSVVQLGPAPGVYDQPRASNEILSSALGDTRSARIEYTSERMRSTTQRGDLYNGASMAVVAELVASNEGELVFHPLVIGGPWLWMCSGGTASMGLQFARYDMGQVFVSDIANFSKVADLGERDEDHSVMEKIKECAFKQCLAEILNTTAPKDWGGEQSDLFVPNMSVGDRRVDGAFILKGRSAYAPMSIKHCGKNGDQILRLAKEPAGLLIVQHCHDVTQPVRELLHEVATQPGRLRNYCVIDGKESVRILKAYDKLDQALELSTG